MALFDPVSITREIEATPFAHARNVIIAYPHFEDWKKLYRPQSLRMPDARGIYRNVDAFEQRYQDMKHDHENNVLKQLRRIQGWAAGRAVFAELRAWRSFFSLHFAVRLFAVRGLVGGPSGGRGGAHRTDDTSANGGGTCPREDAARHAGLPERGMPGRPGQSHGPKRRRVLYGAPFPGLERGWRAAARTRACGAPHIGCSANFPSGRRLRQ
jgi:hypothetical protein